MLNKTAQSEPTIDDKQTNACVQEHAIENVKIMQDFLDCHDSACAYKLDNDKKIML